MIVRPRTRRVAAGAAFTTLAGVWIGHTAEYLRVRGASGLHEELAASVHLYMLPLGVLLALLGAACGLRAWTGWCSLGRRMASTRAALVAAWRGHSPHRPPSRGAGAYPRPGLLAVWAPLTVLQLAVYLLQENLETVAAGDPAPGLAPVTGVHALAPMVHAGVALVLAAALVVLTRVLARRQRAVVVIERLLRVLTARRRHSVQPRRRPLWVPSPRDLLGRQVLRRPPPMSGLI